MKRKYSAIDLFSGCGGLTLGLKKAGFKVIGAIDNDALSVETYKKNHPEVKIWHKDIRHLPAAQVSLSLNLKKGDLNLLAGCPPCQGFSSIRTRNGAEKIIDSRNDLIFDFLRFVKVLQPKAIMLENVSGLAFDKRIKVFCRELKRLGYRYDFQILNAADFGVPQRRRRLILMAGKSGLIEFAKPSLKKKTVRSAIGRMPLPVKSRDPLHKVAGKRTLRIMNLIRKIPKNGGSRKDLGNKFQLKCHKKCNGFNDIYGRMSWNDVAPTLTSGCLNPSKGRFLHPSQNRTMTLREAALLQSFPFRYIFPVNRGRYPIAVLIGNAFPPEFVRRHALNIKEYLKKNRFELDIHWKKDNG